MVALALQHGGHWEIDPRTETIRVDFMSSSKCSSVAVQVGARSDKRCQVFRPEMVNGLGTLVHPEAVPLAHSPIHGLIQ
jgi:hypothetical protein